MSLQLFIVVTRRGHDVSKDNYPELPEGLTDRHAVTISECRQFTRGTQVLEFLKGARDPRGLSVFHKNILAGVTPSRIHVGVLVSSCACSACFVAWTLHIAMTVAAWMPQPVGCPCQ